MSIQPLEFRQVTFHYPEQTLNLFSDLTFSVGRGWSAVIGANGGGKSTILKLACRQLVPHFGSVVSPDACVYVSQRTEEIPRSYASFAYAYDSLACKLHGQLALGRNFVDRWESLSHGERKRAQIGWALYEECDLLCVDEPTNHLDRATMHLIIDSLRSFNGIGLLISHNLEVLDSLCDTTLHVQAPYLRKLSCPPSQAIDEMNQQRIASETAYIQQGKELKRLAWEKQQRSIKAQGVDRRNTKRHIPPKDHDAKARVDAFRVSGKDKVAGLLSNQLNSRLARETSMKQRLATSLGEQRSLDLTKAVGGISVQSSVSSRKILLRYDGAALPLGPNRRIHIPPLTIGNTDRIGIRGPNGIGKSTLLRNLVHLFKEKYLVHWYLAQELDKAKSLEEYHAFEALDPHTKGRVVSAVVRLGSNSELFLGSALPSPGELRKLLIARALENDLELIVLDEPTNHLDLPSRIALQKALDSFQGALLLVSHDQTFLDRLCTVWWDISFLEEQGDSILTVRP